MATPADQIIQGQKPDFKQHFEDGGTINDLDEYGFTFLIESAIAGNTPAMTFLLAHGADVNKPDVTGRTALHWAVDNDHLEQAQILLGKGADPNSFNRGGQSPLVFPLLREQWMMKQLLYQYGASLSFAQDFIYTKLLGHRFEMTGTVDIVNSKGEFIEIDYEGFFLEFSLEVIRHSIFRFGSHFSFRKLRSAYAELGNIIHALFQAGKLLKYQAVLKKSSQQEKEIELLFRKSSPLILPVAYEGHAITLIKCGRFWAKCDRGENALKEGSVNVYWIGNESALTPDFLKKLVFQKQTQAFIHHKINQILDLKPIGQIPLSHQRAGNCSWANVEGAVPTAYVLMRLMTVKHLDAQSFKEMVAAGMKLYSHWLEWDKDRALEEFIQGFYEASDARKASRAAVLGAVLFQGCVYPKPVDIQRAEKIIRILMLPQCRYILESYIEIYCEKQLTVKGNNLLQMLDDLGVEVNQGVTPVARTMYVPKDEK